MAGWIKQFSSSKKQSANDAKERLKLVLIHDRTDLTVDELNLLKNDILLAISKHVDIDPNEVKVSMKQDGREQRLTADIPLRVTKRRKLG